MDPGAAFSHQQPPPVSLALLGPLSFSTLLPSGGGTRGREGDTGTECRTSTAVVDTSLQTEELRKHPVTDNQGILQVAFVNEKVGCFPHVFVSRPPVHVSRANNES